jgi:hypothetical protein
VGLALGKVDLSSSSRIGIPPGCLLNSADCMPGKGIGYVDSCVGNAPGISGEELDYDYQPIRRLRFAVGLIRSASGGDEELFARLTMSMSYVTYFGMTVFAVFCLSLAFPPVRFFFARRARNRQQRRES